MTDESKACPVCGETIKAVAIKCRFCNTDLSAYAATKDGETEKPLFTGHPVVFTLGIAWLIYWLRSLSTTYEITTQRVMVERGLFSKLKENVELFRIDH